MDELISQIGGAKIRNFSDDWKISDPGILVFYLIIFSLIRACIFLRVYLAS